MLADLSSEERDVVRRMLEASVNGPFFPESEFHTLFGVSRATAAAVLTRFPHLDGNNQDDYLAVYNSIANLIGYPHRKGAELEAHGLSPEAIRSVSRALRGTDDVSVQ